MHKRIMAAMFFLFLINAGLAQKKDKKLEHDIETLTGGFHGDIGVYVKNLKNGKTVALNADTIFPTASIVKISILTGIMDKLNKGELSYHQVLQYRDSLLYPGVDILGSFKDTEHIELSKVMMLMLTMSDNTASLWMQKLAGNGVRINSILDSLGFQYTRVNSRTPGRSENQKLYGWGQTTPREIATFMERIVDGTILTPETSARMLRLLGRNYWDEEAISQIPSDVFVADKNGAVDESRSEIMFVNGHGARYIVAIFTKNNKDQSWDPTNEAWVLTRKISKLIWQRYGKK